jgi:hypothetical protein
MNNSNLKQFIVVLSTILFSVLISSCYPNQTNQQAFVKLYGEESYLSEIFD